jgi:hypothetical protein
MAGTFQFDNAALGYSVIIDDDDRVAYAYLTHDGSVVGDVWLYNCGQPPDLPEWHDRGSGPFCNPRDYARDTRFSPIDNLGEVSVTWIQDESALTSANVFIRGEMIARLAPGKKPGWSLNASKDGPLAYVLKSGLSEINPHNFSSRSDDST